MTEKRTKYPAPEHLSEKSQALWREIVPARGRSAGRLALLTVALEALDDMQTVREALATQGLTVTTPKSRCAHINPLTRLLKDRRAEFLRAWAMLGLSWDARVDGSSAGAC